MVVFVSDPTDEPRGVTTIDETDSAVVEKEQVVSYFSDRRATMVGVSPDREQELVLCRCEPCGTRLALAPAFEMS